MNNTQKEIVTEVLDRHRVALAGLVERQTQLANELTDLESRIQDATSKIATLSENLEI